MKPSEVAPRLRGAATDEERSRAREALAAAIQELVQATIRARVRGDDGVDLTQEVTFHILQWIEDGEVDPGKEDAFVRRVAHNKAIDYHRRRVVRQRRETLATEPGWEERARADAPDAEDAAITSEDREAVRLEANHLFLLLARAPQSYKDVLEKHYLHGISLDDLAERELAARDVDRDDADALARERKRARNAVDARLSRARKWLQHAIEQEADG